MLLSMVGETDRRRYEGTEIAICLLSEPAYSVVLRKLWRVKKKETGLGLGENRRPDFQELLTDVRLGIWVRDDKPADHSFTNRIRSSLNEPSSVRRFGGLALGESTHLVNEVSVMRTSPVGGLQFLLNDPEGDLSLPLWADHVGSNTTWGQYRVDNVEIGTANDIPHEAWTLVLRPSATAIG